MTMDVRRNRYVLIKEGVMTTLYAQSIAHVSAMRKMKYAVMDNGMRTDVWSLINV